LKPFQFYVVQKMPKLPVGSEVSNQVQMTFSGAGEDVKTTIKLEAEGYEGPLSLMRIISGIRHDTIGYIKTVVDSQRRKIDFLEFLQPVDFPAYYDAAKSLMLFQAPRKTCRGVLSHLRSKPCGVDLAEVVVDFTKVMQLNSEYLAAWFRSPSSRVRAAGLSGNQIQDDSLFKNLSRVAALSNVTIPWVYDGAEHPIMVTSRGGVVLVRNYQDIGLELRLVMDVHEKLLSRIWQIRAADAAEELEAPDGQP
jgi:hypothetical protein